MRIGLAARWLSLESGGAKEYTEHLIQALLKIDARNEYCVFYNSRQFMGRFPQAREVVIPLSNKGAWDYVGLPLYARRERLDLLWLPSYVVPFFIPCHVVATFHDLAYFLMPEAYKWSDIRYMQTMIPGSVKRAKALLAVSEHTRKDMIRLFPGAAAKTVVTPEAPAGEFRRVTDEAVLAATRAAYQLSAPFVFYAGSLSPRKGIPFLLQAFVQLKQQYHLPHRLVITGGRGWGKLGLAELLAKLPPDDVRILGHVPNAVLPAIYSLADLFVYPSLFEGFGLPVLEAMACGCPVVCSNLTSLPEVAGEAALMVDPYDVPALAEAMCTALTDLTVRSKLIESGLTRAAEFTWETTARKTLKVFEQFAQA